jgi:hypothetical protein
MAGTGIYRVGRMRARAFAAALQHASRYQFSEPDQYAVRDAFPADPATGTQWALGAIGATSMTPPPVGPGSPLLGVLENGFDQSHPDVAGIQLDGFPDPTSDPEAVLHGTAVASVAAAPANGTGISGVWPGARTTVFTSNGTCGDTVAALNAAVTAGARVVNMSYGFSGFGCFAHYVATQRAFGVGTVLVTAAGNEFLEGNPEDGRPATDPHVITVAALNPDLSSADFSNKGYAVDLSAPGVVVLAAVPVPLDVEDGVQDGYMYLDGTSFSSPIVAAGAAWVAAARPTLDHTQITDLIRLSTRDLGRRGWDRTFGFGVFDLPTALTDRAPASDWNEPNDDIEWINGKHFRGADSPIYKGRPVALSARVDRLEDPIDVYRIVVPRRRSVRVTVRARYGNPTLEAYNPYAKTVLRRRGRIAISSHSGRRVEKLLIHNPYRRRIAAWVVVSPRTLDAGYRLQVR